MESSVDPARVVKLNIYPVKSCKVVEVPEIEFDDFGVVGDRRFMMIDGNNRYLSQRRFGVLTTVVAKLVVENGSQFLSMSAPSMNWDLKIEPVKDGPRIDAHLWDCQVRVIDQGDEASTWCNELIGPNGAGAVRLVASADENEMGEKYERFVENIPKSLKERVADVQVGLANDSPVSLVSQESLADLNEKMTQKGANEVALDRFRMNVEISGCSRAFEEDDWLMVRIGEVPFLVYEYCEVCFNLIASEVLLLLRLFSLPPYLLLSIFLPLSLFAFLSPSFPPPPPPPPLSLLPSLPLSFLPSLSLSFPPYLSMVFNLSPLSSMQRCKQTSVNQDTGKMDKTGPVDILRTYRAPRGPTHANFGQLLIPLQRPGKIHVGDTVQIIERKK